MSENSPCNYCTLQSIEKRESKKGNVVNLIAGRVRTVGYGMIGTCVISKDVDFNYLSDKEREDFTRVWFWTLTSKCCC